MACQWWRGQRLHYPAPHLCERAQWHVRQRVRQEQVQDVPDDINGPMPASWTLPRDRQIIICIFCIVSTGKAQLAKPTVRNQGIRG